MDSSHPCRACGRDWRTGLELQDPQKLYVSLELYAEERRAAAERARLKAQEARAVAHIQDTVASAVGEAKRKSHPVSEAEIWKGIVEKDSRISKQLETLCFWARIIGIPFLIAAAIGALKLIGDVAKEIHGS